MCWVASGGSAALVVVVVVVVVVVRFSIFSASNIATSIGEVGVD